MPPPTRASLPLHPPHPTLSHTYGPYVDVIVAKMSRLNVSRSETQGSAPETSAKSHQLKNTKEATHAARFWQRPAGVQATGDRRDSPSRIITQAAEILWLFTVHEFHCIRWHVPNICQPPGLPTKGQGGVMWAGFWHQTVQTHSGWQK